MGLLECKEPIYDRMVDFILQRIEEGVDRSDIAKEMEYKNPSSVDNYMRRKNFSWDSRTQNFVPAKERYSSLARDHMLPLRGVARVDQVVALFDQGESDAKDIAKQVGFGDHIQLGEYMINKGYIWDPMINNYRLGSRKQLSVNHNERYNGNSNHADASSIQDIQSIIPLLQMLKDNGVLSESSEKLDTSSTVMPRYLIKGTPESKTIHIMNTLIHLVKTFSKDFNMTQKAIYETALVEFFQKYGYTDELDICVQAENMHIRNIN